MGSAMMNRRNILFGCACLLMAMQTCAEPATERYSQVELLKNWALSHCLAQVAKDADTKADADATASAYLEFGRQPLEAYEALGQLTSTYTGRIYSGTVESEFNTMKCIDLFHSSELNRLVKKLAAVK